MVGPNGEDVSSQHQKWVEAGEQQAMTKCWESLGSCMHQGAALHRAYTNGWMNGLTIQTIVDGEGPSEEARGVACLLPE